MVWNSMVPLTTLTCQLAALALSWARGTTPPPFGSRGLRTQVERSYLEIGMLEGAQNPVHSRSARMRRKLLGGMGAPPPGQWSAAYIQLTRSPVP